MPARQFPISAAFVVVVLFWVMMAFRSRAVRHGTRVAFRWVAQATMLLLAGLAWCARAAWRAATHRRRVPAEHRDPPFTAEQRAEIVRRAGYQCEHADLMPDGSWLRCQAFDGDPGVILEADHIRPRARGGHSVIENGQALCRKHNRAKSDRVPTRGELRALANRRLGYYMAPIPPPPQPEWEQWEDGMPT